MTCMTQLLNATQITDALQRVPDWTQENDSLTRTVEFGSFAQAIQAVNRIAEIAESEDHHPDIDIRHRSVRFSCTTHFRGGITENDVSMAQEIDGVVTQLTG